MANYDREKMREQLLKRTQEEYAGGISYRYFNADHDLPLWSPKPTKEVPYIIDIIPYAASNNYPQLDKGVLIKEGDPVYRLEIMIHQNIGPKKTWIVCPTANYGKPCPICEAIEILEANGKEYDDYASIAIKRRCAYNVLVYDGKNDEKIQIWEVSHKYSEKPIRLQAKSPRTGGIEPFSDPDIGKSISFEVGNDEYRTIQGHKLIPRDYVIPDDILAKTYTLEDEIILLTYDEIYNLYHFKEESKNIEKISGSQPLQSRLRSNVIQQTEEKDVSDNICLGGGSFGKDIDTIALCGTCKAYNNCAAENDKIKIKEKEQLATSNESSSLTTGRRLRRPS